MISLWRDATRSVEIVRLEEAAEIETLVGFFEGIAEAEAWQPNGALRQWTPQSVYFALQRQGKLAGGLQLVQPTATGTLPCQSVWPEVALPAASRPAHIAILALEASVRGQQSLFWPLTAEMWRYCVGERITTLFLEVTPRIRPLYERLGWPLQEVGELRPHWGEACYLCTLGIADVAEALLRRAEQSLSYQRIVAQMFRVTLTTSKRTVREQEGLPALAG